jgi:hypothetical protein
MRRGFTIALAAFAITVSALIATGEAALASEIGRVAGQRN